MYCKKNIYELPFLLLRGQYLSSFYSIPSLLRDSGSGGGLPVLVSRSSPRRHSFGLLRLCAWPAGIGCLLRKYWYDRLGCWLLLPAVGRGMGSSKPRFAADGHACEGNKGHALIPVDQGETLHMSRETLIVKQDVVPMLAAETHCLCPRALPAYVMILRTCARSARSKECLK